MLNLPKPHPLPHPYEHEEEKNSHQILDFWKTPSSYSKWNSCGRLVASLARPLPPQDKKEVQEWSVRKSYLQIRRTKLNKGTTPKRLALRHFG